MTQFLQNSADIVDYSYTVPETYKLAYATVYIDSGSTNTYRVGINNAGNVGYTSASVRTTFAMIVTAGDRIRIVRENGSASAPWHVGFIRKIF